MVLLFYTISEVYTIFGMVSSCDRFLFEIVSTLCDVTPRSD